MLVRLQKFSQRLYGWLCSPWFFRAVMVLFVIQAGWIAVTARYPQAFDENFHFGLIQLHARQWLPFFDHQPPGEAVHGAIVRDPSYLYHYLFSFPYRLLTALHASQTVQIIVLRLLNVALFASGIVLYRRLLRLLGAGSALTNTILLFFVLLPVVPLLAGQLNYDNLIFALTPGLFILVARFIRRLRADGMVLGGSLLAIIALGAAGSVVKFAFAPIFGAVIVGLTVIVARKHCTVSWPRRSYVIALSLAAVVMLALCFERYGLNLIQYHSPVPRCDKVLSIDECQQYSPWARDYLFAATYPHPSLQGMLVYPFVWLHRMVYETMFTITSYYYEPWHTVTYEAYPPLTIANYTAWTVLLAGGLTALWQWRQIKANRPLWFLLGVSAFYTLVLFLQNFASYRHVGEVVAVHGRYLVPLYPILLLALVLGIRRLLRKHLTYAPLLVLVVLLAFLQGGGISVWIIQSQASWFWQQLPWTQHVDYSVQSLLKYVIYHRM